MMRIFKTIKNCLREICWLALISIAKYYRPRINNSKKVLVLMGDHLWNRNGFSYGDEMLLAGVIETLQNAIHPANLSLLETQNTGRIGDSIVFYGQSIPVIHLSRNWFHPFAYYSFFKVLQGFSSFLVIGADVLDSGYTSLDSVQRLRFLRIANSVGLKTIITPCSYSGSASKPVVKAFKDIDGKTKIFLRDKISYERIKNQLNSVELGADLAFLAKPYTDESKEMSAGLSLLFNEKSDESLVLGINVCGWNIDLGDAFLTLFKEELVALNKIRPLSLVMLPHDTRALKKRSDMQVLERLVSLLNNEIPILVYPAQITSGFVAKKVVSKCSLVISGRMHLAIAALSYGIPTYSFGYQGKFEGLYELMGLPKSMVYKYEHLAKCFADILVDLDHINATRQVILQNVPKAKNLASCCTKFNF